MSRGAAALVASTALLAVCAPAARAADDAARATRADLERMRAALGTHRRATGDLPEDALALGAVLRAHAPSVPQRGGRPVDAWGRPYHYAPAARETPAPAPGTPGTPDYALYSLGPDGVDDGGAGDDLGHAGGDAPLLDSDTRRALELFPVLVLGAAAPLAWALLRWAKRRAT